MITVGVVSMMNLCIEYALHSGSQWWIQSRLCYTFNKNENQRHRASRTLWINSTINWNSNPRSGHRDLYLLLHIFRRGAHQRGDSLRNGRCRHVSQRLHLVNGTALSFLMSRIGVRHNGFAKAEAHLYTHTLVFDSSSLALVQKYRRREVVATKK